MDDMNPNSEEEKETLKALIEVQITDANRAIEEELKKWEEFGVHPGQVIQVDGFLLDTFVHALAQHLVEAGIIVEDDFTLVFKRRLLTALQTHRDVVFPQIQKQRRDQIAAPPTMHIPKTNRKKMH